MKINTIYGNYKQKHYAILFNCVLDLNVYPLCLITKFHL